MKFHRVIHREFSCCGAILLPDSHLFATVSLPDRSASQGSGRRTPRGRSGTDRDMSPDREAKVRGPGPENAEALRRRGGKVAEHGNGRGVTGNRSVSGRSSDRKQLGQSPSGGKRFRKASVSRRLRPDRLAPFPFRALSRIKNGRVMGTSPARIVLWDGARQGNRAGNDHRLNARPPDRFLRRPEKRAQPPRIRAAGRREASDLPPAASRNALSGTSHGYGPGVRRGHSRFPRL